MLLDEARGDVEASMRERMQHWLARHCERSGAVDEVRLVEGLVAWRGPSGIEPVALWPGFSEGAGEALLALASEVYRRCVRFRWSALLHKAKRYSPLLAWLRLSQFVKTTNIR